MAVVHIDASKQYDVLIEKGLLDRAGEIIRSRAGGDRVCIVTDDTVDALYAERLERSLTEAGYAYCKFIVPHGESSKNTDNFIRLLNFLAASRFTRSDVVAALGGGVVGDLAGFAAACYMRGVKFVQLPTTLLAAVDSSVGGKTAVDLETGKNLAGAFYQPEVVICDWTTLDTLPDDIFADGCAEVIKYAVIADRALFELLRQPFRAEPERVITRCVEIKRDVVSRDEFDTGLRAILNFGHTIGHAVEASSRFTLSHGKAVAIGMTAVSRAAAKTGHCTDACARAIQALIRQYDLPTESPYDADTLADKALSDKKRSGGTISLVLPTEIGSCKIVPTGVDAIRNFIALGLQAEQ